MLSFHPLGHRTALGLALVVSLAGCMGPPSTAGLAPWDQVRVTGLSRQLLAAANRWHLSLLQQGHGSGRLQMNSVAIQQQSASLAAHLEAGKGFDQTVYSYRDLRELVDDAHEGVDRSFIEADTDAAWQRLTAVMTEITPFYDARPFGR